MLRVPRLHCPLSSTHTISFRALLAPLHFTVAQRVHISSRNLSLCNASEFRTEYTMERNNKKGRESISLVWTIFNQRAYMILQLLNKDRQSRKHRWSLSSSFNFRSRSSFLSFFLPFFLSSSVHPFFWCSFLVKTSGTTTPTRTKINRKRKNSERGVRGGYS